MDIWETVVELKKSSHTHPELAAAGSKSLKRGGNLLSGNTHASYWNPKVHREQEETENTGAVTCRSMDPR